MTRKPPLATSDDQTRRFAADEARAGNLRDALATLRRAVAAYDDPRVPEVIVAIQAIERLLIR